VVRAERLTLAEATGRAEAAVLAGHDAVLDLQEDVGPPRIPPRTLAAMAEDDGTVEAEPVDWSLPAAPPDPCVPPRDRVRPSNDQVSLGDEAMIGDHLADAVGHYRAALQVNQCNGYAWTALGQLLKEAGYASRARDALTYATRLSPSQVRAWVGLGEVYELLGDKGEAIGAYQRALMLRPGYLPAEDGLRRAARR
jgi:cytochrome c-type biogenesis protein CcmH/NrfG